MGNPTGNDVLRFVVILIFAIIVICYSISIMNGNLLAGLIGIGIGITMIIIGIKKF